jgi:hypothetical protein
MTLKPKQYFGQHSKEYLSTELEKSISYAEILKKAIKNGKGHVEMTLAGTKIELENIERSIYKIGRELEIRKVNEQKVSKSPSPKLGR